MNGLGTIASAATAIIAARRLSGTPSKYPKQSNVSLLAGHRGSATFRNVKGGFKVPRYQNTYRLSSSNPVKCEVIDKILEDVMTATLVNIQYHPVVCAKLCQDMSAEVCGRIYKKDYDRYKFIVRMTIIQKASQGINIGMSRLWDVDRDTYSTFTYETPQLYAVGLVVGLYYE